MWKIMREREREREKWCFMCVGGEREEKGRKKREKY